ncbi:symmetrical bis(5'-nucleosyl)-tetraphosphatase [Candidatus Macondimonas diazotrophica]|jgi:bis(5'-nucleosyl)-tetraphosphatase (symmetrical)|uniref:Bis(5'-nucleosyl)-tetraphosphatase, symmetrical n=1 Tax=Candidatus Macondimonas diazotrophica TaxID=2305248 RepID=A0A4Z0F9W2_9GAMM|nr:symmetrical bis(5'-nucleosyl)-tetraphosphatase [Candidatus Macondimonas diazotrophica]NCU01604.1 symmetrical bis(5'-nucleosyl)-tetraphosphatase [Candidatus Macondimonas diazotrophica]TFZ82400.1 symmetrical bis(5'-nucleosyl)-tetraphosphatase [Candidatus Macondimonas diazotrophica]HBG30781.1 diadenosine tetraphosphatase [Gammaproteobacteria bacterium]
MACYAVGDLQGCLDPLQRLLDRLRFDPASDCLWLTGDLVNRGPQSLESLRFVRDLGASAVTVLGNHDLHLLSLHARGVAGTDKVDPTLVPVLRASDRDELLDWLTRRPLLHHDASLGYTLVHAGLPPRWNLATARRCAAEVEAMLAGDGGADFLRHMYGDKPDRWSSGLTGLARARFIVNALTRMRYCTPDGRLDLRAKGTPDQVAAPLKPWFEVHPPADQGLNVVFGHWSTLGRVAQRGAYGLDTGCVWGGSLTALRLDAAAEDPESWISEPCPMFRAPGGD